MDEPGRRPFPRIRAAALWLAAVWPLAAALLGTAAVPAGRPVQGGKTLPPLALRQYSVNLREVAAAGTITAPFAFWNRSDRPLEITRLEPSCGCLAVKLLGKDHRFTPGMHGLFEAQVQTAREAPGPHTYRVKIHYNDGTPREEVVTFRLQIPERTVSVTPSELYFYQLSGEPLTGELTVEDHRVGAPLKIVEVKSNRPDIRVQLDPQRGGGGVSAGVRVEVPGDVAPGTHLGAITLVTDDEDFPEIRVPVFLQGPPDKVQLTSGTAPVLDRTEVSPAREEQAQNELP